MVRQKTYYDGTLQEACAKNWTERNMPMDCSDIFKASVSVSETNIGSDSTESGETNIISDSTESDGNVDFVQDSSFGSVAIAESGDMDSGGVNTNVVDGDDLDSRQSVNEDQKFTFLQACGMNTMYMFGTGPLITVPYCIASVNPMGPHALIGYGIALVACICDSLVCGEIGSMWPKSGGTYVYLRELYGSRTWGRLAAFMFIWQFLVTGPAEVASGFIAIAEYLVYLKPDVFNDLMRIAISLSLLAFATYLLFRDVKEIGSVTTALTAITIFAMVFTIVAGFSAWHVEYLATPSGAFRGGLGKSVLGVGVAARFGIYDMTGYYDVCFMGEEIRDPKKNIPKSCIATCCTVGVICVLVYVAILGHLDYTTFAFKYRKDYTGMQVGIMSLFTESVTGSELIASLMTVVVASTIFGSVFSMTCGFAFVLYAAARDGYFYEWFAHKNVKYRSLPDHALLTVAVAAGCWCFFSIDIVIEAMTTLLVLVQFVGQSAGLLWYRYRTPKQDQPDGWRMPLYPLPCIIQLTLFLFVFISSPSYLLYGDSVPTLELSMLFMIIGIMFFLLRSKMRRHWPFEDGRSDKYFDNVQSEKYNANDQSWKSIVPTPMCEDGMAPTQALEKKLKWVHAYRMLFPKWIEHCLRQHG